MLERFYAQLPEFARPDHPLMRYALVRGARRQDRRAQVLRFILGVLLTLLLLVPGYQIATDVGRSTLDAANLIGKLFLVLYWPLVLLQIITRIFAISSTSGVIASEVQHGTWDTLKVTTDGAQLTLKTRWAAVFYRLRWLLILLVAARVVFIIGALIDLTSFQGRYLDLLLSGTTPFGPPNVSNELSVVLGIVTTAIMMTASLLMPFTAVAFDAGLGMLLGTVARGRLVGLLGQVILIILRMVVTGLALFVGAAVLSLGTTRFGLFGPGDNPLGAWIGALFGIGEGDLGLTLLHLPHVQRLWADIEYGVLVSIALLGYALLQAGLANLLVKWAGRRATKADTL
jgi:hypothetical protein